MALPPVISMEFQRVNIYPSHRHHPSHFSRWRPFYASVAIDLTILYLRLYGHLLGPGEALSGSGHSMPKSTRFDTCEVWPE